MKLHPITQKKAFAFVTEKHRHHIAPVGSIFQIAVHDGAQIVGVAIVGHPTNRLNANGSTAEVIRLCSDGSRNVCSMLYSACWRAAKALGYTRMITYILEEEPGTSVLAAGWKFSHTTIGRSWDTPSRRRTDKHPLVNKKCYRIQLTP